MLRTLLELGRISNLPTVWTNLLAGLAIAGGLSDIENHLPQFLWLCAAGSLFFWGGMALNDAFGAKWDAEHKPDRPIPSGRISQKTVYVLGFGCLIAGIAIVKLFTSAEVWLAVVLCWGIFAYNYLAKAWAGAFLFMSLVRILLYLLGASIITNYGFEAAPLAIVLGVYIAAITLIARSEDLQNGRTNPIAFLLLLIPAGAALPFFKMDTPATILFPVLLTAWVFYSQSVLRKGGPNIGKGVGRLLAGIVLVDAIAIAPHSLSIALCVAACLPLLLLWQRFVAAT